MGRIVTIEYVDDIDGATIEAEAVDTVEFTYRGREYTLVLSRKNGAQFDEDVARYIRAARKAKSRDQRPAREAVRLTSRQTAVKKPASRSKNSRDKTSAPALPRPQRAQAIREWASLNGHIVSARGRIPAAIQEAYDAAN